MVRLMKDMSGQKEHFYENIAFLEPDSLHHVPDRLMLKWLFDNPRMAIALLRRLCAQTTYSRMPRSRRLASLPLPSLSTSCFEYTLDIS